MSKEVREWLLLCLIALAVGIFLAMLSGKAADTAAVAVRWLAWILAALTLLCYAVIFIGGRWERRVAWKKALAGDAKAQGILGAIYHDGLYGVSRDYDKAVEWYEKAVAQGDAEAMANLALCYLHGTGVEKNLARGVELLHDAALRDVASAKRTLGLLFLEGTGVEKDLSQARRLLDDAANAGDQEAKAALLNLETAKKAERR